MRVPFCDLKIQHREIEKEIYSAIRGVIERSDFILGKDLELLEKEFARFCGVKYAVGVSSGTDALFLSLLSLGIAEGDEVIVPVFTYIATALAVSYIGARPVFVDIREDTYNIDPQKIEEVITAKTKAIIPVHLYGQPADMERILEIARNYNLKVIEDACQAHGARINIDGKWKMAGGLGDIGCFSFYPSKNLGGMGDGGMIVTNDRTIYKKILMLRDYGRISKYIHKLIGYNCRLDTLQAAILRVKLKKLLSWNYLRQEAATRYDRYLKNIEGIITPYVSKNIEHVYHIYAIRTKFRKEILEEFKKRKIYALVHYPLALHLQPAYRDLGYKKGDFPVAETVSKEIVSLPMFPYITDRQIRDV
ncbi:MAG: DegT/DnrJ/EryC1/StrS family aminotransferase, partial [Candidatus Omnitrophica bacterium]|nr:DegT/DnrJ/EryC1/StrS family aminotransferase [Candidatus Omnitrophota bacterium]